MNIEKLKDLEKAKFCADCDRIFPSTDLICPSCGNYESTCNIKDWFSLINYGRVLQAIIKKTKEL
jgi:hypothetical protein